MDIDSMNYAIIRQVFKVPLDQCAEKEKVFLAAAGNQFFKSAENSRLLLTQFSLAGNSFFLLLFQVLFAK